MNINISNANYNKPAFGAKLNGSLTLELSKELFARKLGKYSQTYAEHCKKLTSAGSESSELYLAKYTDGTVSFNLKNQSITSEYEIPMGNAKYGSLLETFFKIKPEHIIKAEQTIKELITEKKNGLLKAAKEYKDVHNKVTQAGQDKNIEKAIQNLDDRTIINLYYQT